MTVEQMLASGPRFTPAMAAAWLAPAFLAVAALIASQGHARAKRRRVEIGLVVLCCVYVVAAGVLMLWPLELRFSAEALRDGNTAPLQGSLSYFFSRDPINAFLGRQDVIAHTLLLAPVGLLLAFILAHHRGMVVVLTLAVCAYSLEALQGLAAPGGRIFDVDQAITLFAGGVFGAVAANVLYAFERVGRLATR